MADTSFLFVLEEDSHPNLGTADTYSRCLPAVLSDSHWANDHIKYKHEIFSLGDL